MQLGFVFWNLGVLKITQPCIIATFFFLKTFSTKWQHFFICYLAVYSTGCFGFALYWAACLLIESQNGWVGRDLRVRPVPTPAVGRGTSHRQGAQTHPAWPWLPPGIGHLQLPWAAVPGPRCPLREEFLSYIRCNSALSRFKAITPRHVSPCAWKKSLHLFHKPCLAIGRPRSFFPGAFSSNPGCQPVPAAEALSLWASLRAPVSPLLQACVPVLGPGAECSSVKDWGSRGWEPPPLPCWLHFWGSPGYGLCEKSIVLVF